jgi:hypothetical protein
MTRRRVRDLRRTMSVVAEQERARLIGLEPNNRGHYRATFVKSTGESTSICVPGTPSDVRGWRNDISLARRVLRR